MKIQFARIVDRFVGTPLCLVYGIFKKIVPFPKPDNQPPQKILIIKFFGLGSITLISSVVTRLIEFFPDTEIYILTFNGNKPLLGLLNFKVKPKLLIVRNENLMHFFLDTIRIARTLRNLHFDIVIDYEVFSTYTELLTAYSNTPIRIGYYLSDFWRYSLYSHYLIFQNAKHVLYVYLDALKYLGIQDPIPAPVNIEIPERVKVSLDEKLPITNYSKVVGVNIHASDLAYVRRWPHENFKVIIERLAKHGYEVLLTGAPDEALYAEKLLQSLEPSARDMVHNICGKPTLEEFLGLLQRLPLFITNDSGPFHLAIIARCPTISFWGPSNPSRYGAFMDKEKHTMLYSSWPCSPCIFLPRTKPGRFCNEEARCLRSITPEKAWIEVRRILSINE